MKKRIFAILCCTFFLVLNGHSVYAEETEQIAFSVTPLDEAENEQSSYYDLKVKPGEEKLLKVRVTNGSDHEITISQEANTATTNDNGLTSYENKKSKDSSLKVPFSEIAHFEAKNLKIAKNKTVITNLIIHIPDKKFDGVILGGLRFENVHAKQLEKSDETVIRNNIAYTIGVVLSENEKKIDPKMQLNSVEPIQKNYRTFINFNLQNIAPRIIKELNVDSKVFLLSDGEEKLAYSSEKDNMRMAPNSNFNYGIDTKNTKLVSGNYKLKISGTADGTPFQFEKNSL